MTTGTRGTTSRPPVSTRPDALLVTTPEALVPHDWLAIEGLVCGFGDRTSSAPKGTVLLQRQVHGTTVIDAASEAVRPEEKGGDGFPRVDVEADALVTTAAGLVVGVRTADCVPLLLVAPHARWAAAVHAGWRGTLAGIAGEAVAAARSAGIGPEQLLAAIGPSIGACCYEVSVELAEDFARAGLPAGRHAGASAGSASKPHLDLPGANRILLERAGVPAANVQQIGSCTRCAHDRYHSFRADPGSVGRQISWIGWADRTPARDRESTR